MSEFSVTPLGTVSPYPKDGKNCPGFLVEYKDNKIMLDCGNGCLSRLDLINDLRNLRIIISHLHGDHYGDLLSLIPTVYVYKKLGYIKNSPDIYIPDGDYYVDDRCGDANPKKERLPDYNLLKFLGEQYDTYIKEYEELNDNWEGINVKSMKVPHQINSNAIKLTTPEGTIVYSSDTGTNNRLKEFAKNADLLICESTFLKGQYRAVNAHLYAHEAGKTARDAKVKKLLLTHFWPELDKQLYLDEALEVFPNTEVAEEGKKLIIRRD